MAFTEYTPDGAQGTLPEPVSLPGRFDPAAYVPSPELAAAVNVALTLGLPLLLTGEPGTGKTQLAAHIAWQFGLGEPLVFNCRTTSTATELLYVYDSLRHFQYIQTRKEELSDAQVEEKFIRYQALGEAIRSRTRRVVLLDEIDKAPRDLPNDLLYALDRLAFEVPEVNKRYGSEAQHRPVVILTSNSEKLLPDAFLRRVAYFHIAFPGNTQLLDILSRKGLGFSEAGLKALIRHFDDVRRTVKKKKPATAELVFWAAALHAKGFPAENLAAPEDLSAADRQFLAASYAVLAKDKDDLTLLTKALD
jgi:MoxR-like ATPase